MTVWPKHGEGPVSLLQRDIVSGRIAHAYLFGGVAGKLPLDAALAFGASLICTKDGCGSCDACRRTLHGSHPDVEVIEPAGTQLLVDQVRDVIRSASRRPVASSRRVIIVEGADRMNPTAQNAFLKALEEPPPSTTIVLLASAPDVLLETVRSRCREVTFHSPTPSEVATILEGTGTPADEAVHLARVGGDLDRALALASDPEALRVRDELVARVAAPMADPGVALEVAEWLFTQTKGVRDRIADAHKAKLDELEQWHREPKRVTEDRLRREQRRAEQDALDASIDDVASVLRDLLVVLAGGDGLLNQELAGPISERAAGLQAGAPARIVAALSQIERCRRRLRANANVLLTMEDIFLAVYSQVR